MQAEGEQDGFLQPFMDGPPAILCGAGDAQAAGVQGFQGGLDGITRLAGGGGG